MTRFLGHGWVLGTEYEPPQPVEIKSLDNRSWRGPSTYVVGVAGTPKATIGFVTVNRVLTGPAFLPDDLHVAVVDLRRIDTGVAKLCIDAALDAAEKLSALKATSDAVSTLWKSYATAVARTLATLRHPFAADLNRE